MSDKVKREKSLFQSFVESAYDDVVTALNLHDLVQTKEDPRERESLEVTKIYHMGAATEKLSKAILSIYTVVLVIPLIIQRELKNPGSTDQKYLENLNKVLKNLRKRLEDPKKLNHEVTKNAHLDELIRILIKIAIGKENEEIRKFYRHIDSFISKNPVKRKYEDVVNLKEEYTKAVKLDYLKEELASVDRCYKQMLAGTLSAECKQWDRETLQKIKEMSYLIPSLSALKSITFEEIIEFLLYSTYLEDAAGSLLRYKDGWTQEVEDYVLDIKIHQNEIIKAMKAMYTFLRTASENVEFEDMLNETIDSFFNLIEHT